MWFLPIMLAIRQVLAYGKGIHLTNYHLPHHIHHRFRNPFRMRRLFWINIIYSLPWRVRRNSDAAVWSVVRISPSRRQYWPISVSQQLKPSGKSWELPARQVLGASRIRRMSTFARRDFGCAPPFPPSRKNGRVSTSTPKGGKADASSIIFLSRLGCRSDGFPHARKKRRILFHRDGTYRRTGPGDLVHVTSGPPMGVDRCFP